MRASLLALLIAAWVSNACAAPPHYFATTAAGLIPPLANPIAAKQYIDTPTAVAYDAHGNLYYANLTQIWRLNAEGTDTLVAGTAGATAATGDGGPAVGAGIPSISALAFDSQENLYIATNGGVRKVTADQRISTLIGSQRPYGIYGIALDSAGNIYGSDYAAAVVAKYPPSGVGYQLVAGTSAGSGPASDGPAATTQLGNPAGLAFSGSLLFIADVGDQELREVNFQTGTIAKVAALDDAIGLGLTAGPDGTIYFGSGGKILKVNPGAGGGVRTVAGIGIGGFTGDGGPATQAIIDTYYLAVNPLNGDLAIADQAANTFRVITAATGIIQTVVGAPHFAGDNGPAVLAQFNATLEFVDGNLATDGTGNLYFFDRGAARIRKISPTGIITTVAGNGAFGNSGDGGKALQASINGSFAGALAVDKAGNIYFVNNVGDAAVTVRKVDTSGNISTVAGGGIASITGGVQATSVAFDKISSIALDSSGDLYLAQQEAILKMDPSGNLSIFSGGNFGTSPDGTPASTARLGNITALAISDSGLLYFIEDSVSLVRMVSSQGLLVTIAGNGKNACCAPPVPGPALSAQLNLGRSLVVDSNSNVYFPNIGSVSFGNQIVMVDPAGNLNIVAGNLQKSGSTGDGGDALQASFSYVNGLTLDLSGNLFVADGSGYIRELSVFNPANPPPFLSAGGIAGSGGSVPPVLTVSPDGDASVYGANFIAAGTHHDLQPSDLVNGKVPTKLAGVCLTFGGVPAAMLNVYPGQINVQVPTLAPGPVTVQVTVNCGTASAVTSNFAGVVVQAASPEFFSFLADPVAGQSPIAALNAVTFVRVGTPGLLPGVTFTPVKPGDIVEAYGTGWGLTNPPLGVGVIPGAAAPLAAPFTLSFTGSVVPSSSIFYAGAAPCCAGLYQVDFTVPAGTPNGNQSLVITIGGAASPSGAYITVQH